MSSTFSLLCKGGGEPPQGCNEVPLCGTGRHGFAVRMSPTFSFCACQKENVPDTVQKKKRLGMNCPAERSNHPKRGLAVTHFRSNLKRPYRLRYTRSFQNCVPAPAGTSHTGAANRTPPTSPSAAALPSCPGRGFQRGGPQPAPLCRFKGVRGEIEIPPAFLFRGAGGTFSFQKRISPLASRPGNRGRPLRQRPLPLAPTWECPLAGASPPPCRMAAHL